MATHFTEHEARTFRELFLGRRGRARAYVFELATAAAWISVGITSLINPATSAAHSQVGRRVEPYYSIWSVLYVVAGVMILSGVLKPMPALRVAGLVLMGAGLLMQTVAAASFALEPRVAAPLIYAVACYARALMITKLIVRLKRHVENA